MRTPTLALIVEQLIADGHYDLAEYMIARTADTKRLDFLENQGGGRRWVARDSLTNRGYRLHQSNDAEYETARAAIDAAMCPLPDNATISGAKHPID